MILAKDIFVFSMWGEQIRHWQQKGFLSSIQPEKIEQSNILKDCRICSGVLSRIRDQIPNLSFRLNAFPNFLYFSWNLMSNIYNALCFGETPNLSPEML